MSRFSDDWDGPDFNNQAELWEMALFRAINGKRGQRALRELEQALLELPEPRLISGHLAANGQVCAVGAMIVHEQMKRGKTRDEALERISDEIYVCTCGHDLKHHQAGPCSMCVTHSLHYTRIEGWTACQSFMPDLDYPSNDDMADHTASAGRSMAGLAYTLAWQLAYVNDEECEGATPEHRYEKVLAWVREAQIPDAVPA